MVEMASIRRCWEGGFKVWNGWKLEQRGGEEMSRRSGEERKGSVVDEMDGWDGIGM